MCCQLYSYCWLVKMDKPCWEVIMLQHLLNIHFQAFAHTFSLFSDEAGKHFNYMYLLKPASSSLLPFLVGFTFRSFLTKRPQSAKLRKPYMHIPYKSQFSNVRTASWKVEPWHLFVLYKSMSQCLTQQSL